jgi:hypothetical protein
MLSNWIFDFILIWFYNFYFYIQFDNMLLLWEPQILQNCKVRKGLIHPAYLHSPCMQQHAAHRTSANVTILVAIGRSRTACMRGAPSAEVAQHDSVFCSLLRIPTYEQLLWIPTCWKMNNYYEYRLMNNYYECRLVGRWTTITNSDWLENEQLLWIPTG